MGSAAGRKQEDQRSLRISQRCCLITHVGQTAGQEGSNCHAPSMSDSAGGKTAVESKKGNKRRGDFGRDFFLPQVLRKGHMIFEQEFEGENHVCI
jgi:hypothetical protein